LFAHISEQYLAGVTVVVMVVVAVADGAVVVLIVVVVVERMVVEVVLDGSRAKFNTFLSLLCMRKLFPEENPV
jgi:hypothetical protein